MGLFAELSLSGKPVLVVGGGAQALRKARRFAQEGACLTAVSPSFTKGFETACDRILSQKYETSLLDGMFLVVAATDDRALNHRIVSEANARGILSMSVHQDSDAAVHSVGSREFGGITAAVSTHGAYPALDSALLERWETCSEPLTRKLPVLKVLRERIVFSSLEVGEKRELLKKLPAWEETALGALACAAGQGRLLIAVWHGTAREEAMRSWVFPFSREIEVQYPSHPVCEAFLSEKMRDKLSARGISVPLLGELLHLAEVLGIARILLQPVLLAPGNYSRQMLACAREFPHLDIVIGEPLVAGKTDAQELFCCLRKEFPGEGQKLFVCHGFEPEWQKLLRGALLPGEALLAAKEEPPVLRRDLPVQVIPLFLLLGAHTARDVFDGEGSVCARLAQNGYQVREERAGLMELACVRRFFLKKIRKVFL